MLSRFAKPRPGIWPDRSHPRYRGCIAHWLFNEGGANLIRDVSGHGRNGTLQNMSLTTGWEYSDFGLTASFDGTDDYMDGGTNIPTLSQPWSLSCWFVLDVAPGSGQTEGVIGFAETVEYATLGIINSGGTLYIKIVSSGETPGNGVISLVAGDLNHYAMVHDGTDLIAYLNGRFDYSVTPTGSGWQTSTSVHAGISRPTGSVGEIDGRIEDARMYNRALTAAEVLSLYRDPFLEFRLRRDVYAPEPVAAGDPEGPLVGGKLVGGGILSGRLAG